MARIARPSAPPTCWDVLIRPLASPASRPDTPLTAATVIGTNAKPRPNAASSEAGRMSETYLPSGETWANQISPPAVRSSPAISVGLKPMRVTSVEATPAETMIPKASGR